MSSKKTGGAVFSTAQPAAANFAAENRKKKRKPQDHLEYDVMQAEALGYGCHYGKYKADHPNTRAEFEELYGVKTLEKVAPDKREKTCPVCGKKFIVGHLNTHKIYCSDECRRKKDEERQRERAQAPAGICLWCGGQITDPTMRSRYCCPGCFCAARRERKRRRLQEKEAAEHGTD